ncbi:MAG: type II toxin-antitoxin system mRNA interferase toxin, RelE/StbE family [bacterium]|nr:type II toxin-antitoxin system mRNA interferase toxin, RelE/StbE family [bacterium]
MVRPIREIYYSSQFARAYKKLPPDLQKQAQEREAIFRTNAVDVRLKTHKLRGRFAGFWSFSISYSHRIVFTFVSRDTAVFHDIGDHRVYR